MAAELYPPAAGKAEKNLRFDFYYVKEKSKDFQKERFQRYL